MIAPSPAWIGADEVNERYFSGIVELYDSPGKDGALP
jgi:hypothetical protein